MVSQLLLLQKVWVQIQPVSRLSIGTASAGGSHSLARRINPLQPVQCFGTEWLGITLTGKEISTSGYPKTRRDLALYLVVLASYWTHHPTHEGYMKGDGSDH